MTEGESHALPDKFRRGGAHSNPERGDDRRAKASAAIRTRRSARARRRARRCARFPHRGSFPARPLTRRGSGLRRSSRIGIAPYIRARRRAVRGARRRKPAALRRARRCRAFAAPPHPRGVGAKSCRRDRAARAERDARPREQPRALRHSGLARGGTPQGWSRARRLRPARGVAPARPRDPLGTQRRRHRHCRSETRPR